MKRFAMEPNQFTDTDSFPDKSPRNTKATVRESAEHRKSLDLRQLPRGWGSSEDEGFNHLFAPEPHEPGFDKRLRKEVRSEINRRTKEMTRERLMRSIGYG